MEPMGTLNIDWGLPFRTLKIALVQPKKGTTMETIGRVL